MDNIVIAAAKGRLAEEGIRLLELSGIRFPDYSKKSRKLVFLSEDENIKMVMVKPGDVPVYVERGTCDIGIVGKDVLVESRANLYEILDLGFGKCKMITAATRDISLNRGKKLRVATKYPNMAKDYFNNKGEMIDIIKLNGSVELAPVMGLSDIIVDIVETGKTLKENGLHIVDTICDLSARLVVNKVSFKTKTETIEKIVKSIQSIMGEESEVNIENS
ncbi:MAG: ATP phosphoribosyltransferase [Clostridiaceae bacterium]